MIQPALWIRGIAEGLCKDGVLIHENSPVTNLKWTGDWIATTPDGQVTAPQVILAVNGHLNSFGYAKSRLMHVFTYASMTRALSPQEIANLGGHAIWGLTPADPVGTTVRRISGIGGDRLIIRNRFTFDPNMEVNEGRVGDMAMEYRWGGRLCLSRNNVQVIGELEPGLFSACCQNGLGTAKGTLAGGLAADLALGRSSPALSRALSADAPKRLPPEPISRLGANLYLRWQEGRASGEL
jgi:glycine/D-amino acid oxidase-like deaminating enzyme